MPSVVRLNRSVRRIVLRGSNGAIGDRESAITSGAFVGIAAAPIAGGGWKALEVLLFPESARGSGEGHYGWDLTPDSSMPNATVAGVVSRASPGRDRRNPCEKI